MSCNRVLCVFRSESALLTAEWENDATWRKDGCADSFCRVCLREGEAADARCLCGTLVCHACLQAHFPEESGVSSRSGCLRCRKFCPRRKQAALPSRKAQAVALLRRAHDDAPCGPCRQCHKMGVVIHPAEFFWRTD